MATDKSDKPVDQDQILAMIDAKLAALHALRASYIAAVSVGAFGQGGEPLSGSNGGAPHLGMGMGAPMELPRGALLGKSLPAAIKLYLSAIKRKQTIKEIAQALRDGGVETTAANFETPITSAINRLKVSGEVLRFKDGWALAEFYPESLRNRIEKDAKPAKKRGKAKKGAKKASTETKSVKAEAKAEGKTSDGPSLGERLAVYLKANAGKRVTAQKAAEAVGESHAKVVAMAFGRLTKEGKLTKGPDGTYTAA